MGDHGPYSNAHAGLILRAFYTTTNNRRQAWVVRAVFLAPNDNYLTFLLEEFAIESRIGGQWVREKALYYKRGPSNGEAGMLYSDIPRMPDGIKKQLQDKLSERSMFVSQNRTGRLEKL